MRAALAVLILSAAALAGCAAAPTAVPATATVAAPPPAPVLAKRVVVGPDHVTLEDQNATIELKPGTRVHVWLESDRTTKQRWQLTSVSGNAVAQVGNSWYAAKHAYAVRELGNWIFDFNAVAPGKATVTFDYRSDAEPVTAAMRKATFDFVVR